MATLHLKADWQFYAPEPSFGEVLRYHLISPGGERSPAFALTEALDKNSRAYYRFASLYLSTPRFPAFLERLGHYLCARHASGRPGSVELTVYFQKPIMPEAYANGARPLDPDFLDPVPFQTVACPPDPAE